MVKLRVFELWRNNFKLSRSSRVFVKFLLFVITEICCLKQCSEFANLCTSFWQLCAYCNKFCKKFHFCKIYSINRMQYLSKRHIHVYSPYYLKFRSIFPLQIFIMLSLIRYVVPTFIFLTRRGSYPCWLSFVWLWL
jgi:hypothetical protein